MLIASLTLFTILAAGIYLACWMFGYEISHARRLGSAAAFVVADVVAGQLPNFLFVGRMLLQLLIPVVTLYICLMDDTFDRDTVNKVFGVSLFIGVFGSLSVHYLFR